MNEANQKYLAIMTNSKTPLVVEASKEIHAFSFSPTFKFNSFFYCSLRSIHGGINPWKDKYGRSLITAFNSQNRDDYASKLWDDLFPIHHKTIFHKILNNGAIYEKDMNKENFEAFIEKHNSHYPPSIFLSFTWYVKPQIQILRMINRCYSWHLEGQPQSEYFKKNLCEELDALLRNPKNHRTYPVDGFDKERNKNRHFTHMIDEFLKCIREIGESSPVSDLQQLTIELMMDINLAFIKLLEDKHGIIKPDYPLESNEWLNWEELSKYFKLLPSYADKKGKYFKVNDVIGSLNCFINNYMVEQVTNSELAGTDYHYSGRIIYWHNFKYDQKTAQDMHQLGSTGLMGNDLFNIYCCYWPEFVELKKLYPMQSTYPYFYDAVSANYIRTVRPDFENKLNQMAQLLDWESHRKGIIESLQSRNNDAQETISS